MKEKPMSEVAPIYIYATEVVSEYYSLLDLKGRKILTICGSGDQAINAIFFGAKETYAFDLNKNCKHILDLKITAIKYFSYGEFLTFFGDDKVNVGFEYNFYRKLRSLLTTDTRQFFDQLYMEFGNDGSKMVKSHHFRQRDDFVSLGSKMINAYLSDEKCYNKTKELLNSKEIKFVHSDLKSVCDKINLKFDIINLSNVPNYLMHILDKTDPVNDFIEDYLIRLKKILSKEGEIFFVSYSDTIYPNRIAEKCPLISTKEGLKKLKLNGKFIVIQKEHAGLRPGTKDRITILKKAEIKS